MQDLEDSIISASSASPQESTANQLPRPQVEKILDENAEIYRRQIHKTSFKTRTQGMVAGGGLGMFFGAAIGVLAALSTLLLPGIGWAIAAPMMLPVIGAFAAAGCLIGAALLIEIDNTTGVVVGGEKVQDRKKLYKNASDGLSESILYHGNEPEKITFWNRIIPFTKGSAEIFNLRTGLIFGAIGVAVAALLFFSGPGIGIAAITAGIHGVTHAAIGCMTLTTGGLFGALFGGLDLPTISANAVEFVANIFSGKAFAPKEQQSSERIKAATQLGVLAPSPEAKAPVVFKANSASTLGTPLGSYAGVEPDQQWQRKMAEQKFKAMNTSQGMALH